MLPSVDNNAKRKASIIPGIGLVRNKFTQPACMYYLLKIAEIAYHPTVLQITCVVKLAIGIKKKVTDTREILVSRLSGETTIQLECTNYIWHCKE